MGQTEGLIVGPSKSLVVGLTEGLIVGPAEGAGAKRTFLPI